MSEESGSDDLSGLTGFFFYAFIVHPMTAWILKPGRFERRKSIMYAIAFLAALAAIKTGKICICLHFKIDRRWLFLPRCIACTTLVLFFANRITFHVSLANLTIVRF